MTEVIQAAAELQARGLLESGLRLSEVSGHR